MDGSIGAIRFAADGRTIARLYQSGAHDRVDWDEEQQTGLTGLTCFGLKPEASQNGAGSTPAFAVKDGLDGSPTLRINETTCYVLEYERTPDGGLHPRASFQNEGKNIRCDRNGNSVTFQFVNYLGRSRLAMKTITSSSPRSLPQGALRCSLTTRAPRRTFTSKPTRIARRCLSSSSSCGSSATNRTSKPSSRR